MQRLYPSPRRMAGASLPGVRLTPEAAKEEPGEITVRHAEPDDCEAIHRIMSGPRTTAGTLQLPFQSVGHLGQETSPTRPRRRHVGTLGMAVRDDLQGRVGDGSWKRRSISRTTDSLGPASLH